jgi:hemerythrin
MPIISWDNTLSVGYSAIDKDHKELVRLFNEAHRAVEQTIPRDQIERMLTELIGYTHWHFDHEEKLMAEHGYNRTKPHKLEHQELADNIKELYEQFLAGDDTTPNVLLPLLRNWLTNHIMKSDMRLGDFLTGFSHREL